MKLGVPAPAKGDRAGVGPSEPKPETKPANNIMNQFEQQKQRAQQLQQDGVKQFSMAELLAANKEPLESKPTGKAQQSQSVVTPAANLPKELSHLQNMLQKQAEPADRPAPRPSRPGMAFLGQRPAGFAPSAAPTANSSTPGAPSWGASSQASQGNTWDDGARGEAYGSSRGGAYVSGAGSAYGNTEGTSYSSGMGGAYGGTGAPSTWGGAYDSNPGAYAKGGATDASTYGKGGQSWESWSSWQGEEKGGKPSSWPAGGGKGYQGAAYGKGPGGWSPGPTSW